VQLAAADLVSRFRDELEHIRPRADDVCWRSLDVALAPALELLGVETGAATQDLPWEAVVHLIDASVASDISDAIKTLSLALTELYRCSSPHERRLAYALGLLYTDVARPLWAAHPMLKPLEMRQP
jgi:hypothetical protein